MKDMKQKHAIKTESMGKNNTSASTKTCIKTYNKLTKPKNKPYTVKIQKTENVIDTENDKNEQT